MSRRRIATLGLSLIASLGAPAAAGAASTIAGGTPLSLQVVLQPRDPAALSAFATGVSTPGSPLEIGRASCRARG